MVIANSENTVILECIASIFQFKTDAQTLVIVVCTNDFKAAYFWGIADVLSYAGASVIVSDPDDT